MAYSQFIDLGSRKFRSFGRKESWRGYDKKKRQHPGTVMRKRNIREWPVRKASCSSCPFRIDPRTGREQDPQLAGQVQARVFSASQICHHPTLHGKPETHLCRAARDYQTMIFFRLGILSAPTDEAWEAKSHSAQTH